MLMRFDPFREIERLTQQANGPSRPAVMAMDAYREGDQFVVQFDLPGVAGDSIELTVEKNVLTVSAERRTRRQDNQEWVVAERPQGSFSRQLFLGEGLNPDGITASYDSGVLTVTVPVAEQAKPRKVEVTTAAGSSADTTKAINAESTEA